MITVLIRKYHNADDVHSSPEKGHVGHPWSVWVGSLLRLSLCKKDTIKPIQLKDLETTITLRKAGRLLDESCNFPSPGFQGWLISSRLVINMTIVNNSTFN